MSGVGSTMQRLKELQNKKIQELQAKVQEPTTSNRELTERFELKEMTAHVSVSGEEDDRGDYNLTILKQVQSIFGHLSSTQLQYYVPKGLWRFFKMQGGPVNLREQQDAVEFFMTLIDTIDEAMKSVGHEQVCSKVLGGLMSDQKICKTCPHRYSRQEPCSVISVDVKNHNNLQDSLAEYTKGELLETENAYYCERCDKKVDTVKRLCVKKLPPILVIQLKRFDYDFERDAAVKFNDYFEFPRELDMEPYTVAGLARRENEAVDCEPEDLDPGIVRKYRLRGMVVHSGQASGGHYYSYIKVGTLSRVHIVLILT
jgi:ubiquitin carboxyl-terminal hydrolase 9/24